MGTGGACRPPDGVHAHTRAHRAGAWPAKCLSVALSKEVKEGNQGFLLADKTNSPKSLWGPGAESLGGSG